MGILSEAAHLDGANSKITVPWSTNARHSTCALESDGEKVSAHNEILVQSIVRAHTWKQALLDGTYESIEKLAEASRLHPKVVRQALRLAFLSPDVTSAILEGRQSTTLSLAHIPKLLPLRWTDLRVLG
jgi:site-specific DNA recombinase